MLIEWIGLSVIIIVLIVFAYYSSKKMSGLNKAIDEIKTKMDVMAAPTQTLTDVATALQTNVGTLGKSISDMNQSIGNINTQAAKIETLGQKYAATEELTRKIHSIMIGSYEKGKSGENYLRNMMTELMKIGLVRQNVPFGTKVVEYCVVFNDGKHLAIDSKVVATQDVEALFDESTSDADREGLRKSIRNALKRKVEEVCQYIDPQKTLPCAVMAIPDSLVDMSSEIVPDAVGKSVLVAGYSAVPQLIVYFVRIHGFYAIEKDVAELKDSLMSIQQEISGLDDRFFANRFEKPIGMLNNAVLKTRQIISNITGILATKSEVESEQQEED